MNDDSANSFSSLRPHTLLSLISCTSTQLSALSFAAADTHVTSIIMTSPLNTDEPRVCRVNLSI